LQQKRRDLSFLSRFWAKIGGLHRENIKCRSNINVREFLKIIYS
jgi:hypothetical protein